ncbi:hypothetical protein QE564_07190 [Escherichia coli]|uniref:hypothetical protein n=1 Tax=Enterobacteriaceae TaxID=543 RepID=UPI0020774DFE|nr:MULTISPECIES: hypothetical protein [Enterobacteriaceae]MCU7039166.1 hypothetical protein [Escherichia coli]MDH7319801.1 hypothetical protein [Escherichia coli]MDH7323935.1 hypothetical protein [Escherichia coli]WAZ88146.1 hypothetical protein O3296_00390 [Escherichia coli]WIE12636.1 hypothetical protein N4697_000580 [Escherichia coli]
MPAGVALYSIISNNSHINLHFHLLISGIEEKRVFSFLRARRSSYINICILYN